MAIKRPDIYEHNNVNYAIADSDFVRGGLRTAVADLTALYALSPKVDQLKERSTIVYVSGETKYYILTDIGNVGNINGWEEFVAGGSGNGTVTGATNGLSTILSGTTVILGGDLLQNTFITDSSENYWSFGYKGSATGSTDSTSAIFTPNYIDLTVYPNSSTWSGNEKNRISVSTNGAYMYSFLPSGNYMELRANEGCLHINDTARSFGARYCNDYYLSGSTDPRWIPDWGAVTGYTQSAVTQSSNTVDVCIVCSNYSATTTNDFIGVSGGTSMSIWLPVSQKLGQRVSVVDICNFSLTNPITICGSGKLINGCNYATINTDYGSITFINNGISWSAVSFIN